MNDEIIKYVKSPNVFSDACEIIEVSKNAAYRAVNLMLVQRNWMLGKRIAEEGAPGENRADNYGKEAMKKLSTQLTEKYGKGYELSSLYKYVKFYKLYPDILDSSSPKSSTVLSWTHYRELIRVEDYEAREWYEEEARRETWSVKTLQRNISSQYYYRLLKSQVKATVIEEMQALTAEFQNDNLELIEFRNRFDCTVRCKKCNSIFDIHVLGYLNENTTHNLCRKCYPNKNSLSETEPLKFVENILIENNISFKKNDKTILKPYEIDLLIDEMKIGIEVNGNYWHSEIGGGRGKNYHINKTIEAEKKGIKLIHIFEDEIINKPNIIESRIKNMLNITDNKIYARECQIKEVDYKDKNLFFNENHIDGDTISKYAVGLYHNNKLVSCASFGYRKISGKEQFELIRFANVLNTSVVGGFSKILKFFIEKYKPSNLITYANIRWSGINHVNTVYNKNGFKFVGNTNPNYFYVDKHNYLIRMNRLNFTKQNLKKLGYDDKLTESQIMLNNGYDRLWDCGSMKFEYINNLKEEI